MSLYQKYRVREFGKDFNMKPQDVMGLLEARFGEAPANQQAVLSADQLNYLFDYLIEKNQIATLKWTTVSNPSKTTATIDTSISIAIVITDLARRRALSIACASTSPLNTGTNAAVSAPSPKSLRAMFGRANASVNALCSTPEFAATHYGQPGNLVLPCR